MAEMDLTSLMQQAQALQTKMQEMQEAAAEAVFLRPVRVPWDRARETVNRERDRAA